MMYSYFRIEGTFQKWVDRGIDRGRKTDVAAVSERCRGDKVFRAWFRDLQSVREGEVGNVLV
jgi:hypothetical protein